MRPLTLEERQAIIAEHPHAAPDEIISDIDEYDRLVSDMFATDPDEAPAAAPAGFDATSARDSRLEELHRRLFDVVSQVKNEG